MESEQAVAQTSAWAPCLAPDALMVDQDIFLA